VAVRDRRRAEAVRLLNLQAIPSAHYEAFWARLGISYFIRTDPADIAWHTRVLAGRATERGLLVKTRMAPIGEGFQTVVYTRDQPELFARICGYFDSRNLSILDAQIHTTPDGEALDSFLIVELAAKGDTVSASLWSRMSSPSGCSARPHCPRLGAADCLAARGISR